MAGRMPAARAGTRYWDANLGQWMLKPAKGRAVPLHSAEGEKAGISRRFDVGGALRRSGVQARGLGSGLADDTAKAAQAVADRQPFQIGAAGTLIVGAVASLLGLLVLDLLLRPQGTRAYGALIGGAGSAISALLAPEHPLFARRPVGASANTTAAVTTSTRDSSRRAQTAPPAAGTGGRFFPLRVAASPGQSAPFSDDFNSPRAGGGWNGIHGAIDLAAPRGTPIVAVESGVVRNRGWNTYGGNRVWVGNWYYAHLDRYAAGLKEGALVKAGQVIGYVGNTGQAGGVFHLHLGYSDDSGGSWLNPFSVLKSLWAALTKAPAASWQPREVTA